MKNPHIKNSQTKQNGIHSYSYYPDCLYISSGSSALIQFDTENICYANDRISFVKSGE